MTNITVLIRKDKSIILFFRMDRQFLMEYLRRLRRRRKICLRQSILYLDLCAAAPGRFFACAGDLPQSLHGFHPGPGNRWVEQIKADQNDFNQQNPFGPAMKHYRTKDKSKIWYLEIVVRVTDHLSRIITPRP